MPFQWPEWLRYAIKVVVVATLTVAAVIHLAGCGYHWGSSPWLPSQSPLHLTMSGNDVGVESALRALWRPWLADDPVKAHTIVEIRACHHHLEMPTQSNHRFDQEKNVGMTLSCRYRWKEPGRHWSHWRELTARTSFTLNPGESTFGSPRVSDLKLALVRQWAEALPGRLGTFCPDSIR